MQRTLKCIALVSTILLSSIGFFGSTGFSPNPPNPAMGLAEADYYVIAGWQTVPMSWPGPTPPRQTNPGIIFSFLANQPWNPSYKSPYGYNMSSIEPDPGEDWVYRGCLGEGADPAYGDSNAYVKVTITNNLGHTITIEDLQAEVTDGTSMIHWYFPYASIWMGNMSLVAVDTLDPWDYTAPTPPAPYDEVNYNTGVVQVYRDYYGYARGYPDWYRYCTGIPGHPYPVTQYGPASLLMNDPGGDALTTGHVATKYGGSPITLAHGASLTEYFGITIFGVVNPGDLIDATITLRLKYNPPSDTMKLHALPEEMINLYDPLTTLWHELYPTFSNVYHLTSWHDDNQDAYLSPGDEIDIYNDITEETTWWYVQTVTTTLHLDNYTIPPPGSPPASGDIGPVEEMYVEAFEPPIHLDPWPFDLMLSTIWHEAWPTWCNLYHVTAFFDSNGNQIVDFCDWVQFNGVFWYHVTAVATDLELLPEIAGIDIVNAVTVVPGYKLLDTVEGHPEWPLPINVTVKNTGTLPLIGSVSGYYSPDNVTYLSMGSSQPINLQPCNGTMLEFIWNLKAALAGKHVYFMKFNVTASYSTGQKTITATDEFFMKFKVRVMGDVDGDNDCDVGDQRKMQLVMFLSVPPLPPNSQWLLYNSTPLFTDCDGDGDIDVGDQRKQQLHMFELWTDP